ncbi:tetratricopeptide repeat protein [Gimibacter soli]|uniref:Tetratricopeptide repeat protein n=1 Tax=Gimibacter soli TaxID=3024400 RepID=A0AAE9XPU7_9PROT|nr:tetratricopeptide repeat protein [Gimibacter soli]WCL52735.1 tetratricopeptide repeat protein [Gimibacter soli]
MTFLNLRKSITGAALCALLAAPVVAAQTAPQYQALSKDLVTQAEAALAKDAADAQLLFERALVADPANVEALVGLGHAFEEQGKLGRSLKYYRQALEIRPNNVVALESQALAFLKRKLPDRAERNRARIAEICANDCPSLDKVTAAIEAHHAAAEAADAKSKMADATPATEGR